MNIGNLIKKKIVDAVASLPIGQKRAIFTRLAREFGITALQARGDYGPILSAPGDYAVFLGYLTTGKWASATNGIFERFFDKPGLYLDIGANIGLTTIPVARNPLVKCIAFEPDPTNFENLRQNVLLNCLNSNVSIHNLALFNRHSTLQLELAERNFGDHRIRAANAVGGIMHEERRPSIAVQAVPLDDFLVGTESMVAAKIDTQGAEPYVIEGGKKVLGDAELVVMEFSPYHMARLGGDPKVVFDFVRDNFASASIAEREGEFGAPEPAELGARKLEEIWKVVSADASNRSYFDVCVGKCPVAGLGALLLR